MPALGNGLCGYSDIDCANAVVDAMIEVSLLRNCSLTKIVICLDDEQTYKVFRMELEQSQAKK
jgi:hypothetical protein